MTTMFDKIKKGQVPATPEEFIEGAKTDGAARIDEHAVAGVSLIPTFQPTHPKDKGGRPHKQEGVKRINKQTNLPEPLIERGKVVADVFFAGNFSELTAQALERFIVVLEQKLKEMQ